MTEEHKDIPIPAREDDSPDLATARAVAARDAWRASGAEMDALRPDLQYIQRRYDEARQAQMNAAEAVRLAAAAHAQAVLAEFEATSATRAALEPLAELKGHWGRAQERCERARSDFMRQQNELWQRFARGVPE
ncbi:MAG: hypothetical protein AB7I35_21645 [Ramlibacter sp.]